MLHKTCIKQSGIVNLHLKFTNIYNLALNNQQINSMRKEISIGISIHDPTRPLENSVALFQSPEHLPVDELSHALFEA